MLVSLISNVEWYSGSTLNQRLDEFHMTRFWDNIFQKYSVKMYSAEGTMYVRETGFA